VSDALAFLLCNRIRADPTGRDCRNDFRTAPQEGGEVHAHAQKDAGEVGMLGKYLIFLGMVYSLAALGFVIWLFFPVVWHADIKPFIEEMLGPRR